MKNFICNIDTYKPIGKKQIESLGINSIDDLYYNSKNIAKLSLSIKENNKDVWIKLPFSNNLEEELSISKIFLSFDCNKLKKYAFDNIISIPRIFNLNTQRTSTMLRAVNSLRDENIIYRIEGPFTVITSLLELSSALKFLKDQQSNFNQLLHSIEELIIQYATLAYRNGAKILSIGDPVATIDVIGLEIFNTVYKYSLIRILKSIETKCPKAIIHLCGKLTNDLLETSSANITTYKFSEELTYGESLLKYYNLNPIKRIIGYRCMKNTIGYHNEIYIIDNFYNNLLEKTIS